MGPLVARGVSPLYTLPFVLKCVHLRLLLLAFLFSCKLFFALQRQNEADKNLGMFPPVAHAIMAEHGLLLPQLVTATSPSDEAESSIDENDLKCDEVLDKGTLQVPGEVLQVLGVYLSSFGIHLRCLLSFEIRWRASA